MKQSNKIKRQDNRRQDFDKMMQSSTHEGSVRQRMDSGGYHKPGSWKK